MGIIEKIIAAVIPAESIDKELMFDKTYGDNINSQLVIQFNANKNLNSLDKDWEHYKIMYGDPNETDD